MLAQCYLCHVASFLRQEFALGAHPPRIIERHDAIVDESAAVMGVLRS